MGLLVQDYMIGPDKALDPNNYFIVTIALFANGEVSDYSVGYMSTFLSAVSVLFTIQHRECGYLKEDLT